MLRDALTHDKDCRDICMCSGLKYNFRRELFVCHRCWLMPLLIDCIGRACSLQLLHPHLFTVHLMLEQSCTAHGTSITLASLPSQQGAYKANQLRLE